MEKKKSSGFDKTVTLILVLICLVLLGATLYKMFSPEEEIQRVNQVTHLLQSAQSSFRQQGSRVRLLPMITTSVFSQRLRERLRAYR